MPYSLGEIASLIGAELHGDPSCIVNGVAPLGSAGKDQLTFLGNRRFASLLAGTRAAAVILAAPDLAGCPVHALVRSEEHTSELQSRENLVCRLLLEKKKNINRYTSIA